MSSPARAIHGELTLATFGQVLWVRVCGSVNREFIDMLVERVIEVATPICDRPWIGVTDLLQWELGPPDAMAGIKPVVEWYESHNRSHSVNMITEQVLQDVLLRDMVKGIKRHSERFVVHSLDDAVKTVSRLQPNFDPQEMRKSIYGVHSDNGLKFIQ